MNNRFSLSAYWSARKESAEQCAERAVLFMEELRKVDGLFSTWYLKTQSRKDATARLPLAVDRDHLTRLFTAGVNRRDDDRSPIGELGFHFGIWAGSPDGVSAGLSITCGSYNEHLDNVCVLKVAEGHDISADAVKKIVDAAVRAWDPDAVEVNANRVYSR